MASSESPVGRIGMIINELEELNNSYAAQGNGEETVEVNTNQNDSEQYTSIFGNGATMSGGSPAAQDGSGSNTSTTSSGYTSIFGSGIVTEDLSTTVASSSNGHTSIFGGGTVTDNPSTTADPSLTVPTVPTNNAPTQPSAQLPTILPPNPYTIIQLPPPYLPDFPRNTLTIHVANNWSNRQTVALIISHFNDNGPTDLVNFVNSLQPKRDTRSCMNKWWAISKPIREIHASWGTMDIAYVLLRKAIVAEEMKGVVACPIKQFIYANTTYYDIYPNPIPGGFPAGPLVLPDGIEENADHDDDDLIDDETQESITLNEEEIEEWLEYGLGFMAGG